MPKQIKCINDETKTYTGDEPTPRGLGYSASKLDIGHTQEGKDGNMYTVKKHGQYNRWVKEKDIVSKGSEVSKDKKVIIKVESKDTKKQHVKKDDSDSDIESKDTKKKHMKKDDSDSDDESKDTKKKHMKKDDSDDESKDTKKKHSKKDDSDEEDNKSKNTKKEDMKKSDTIDFTVTKVKKEKGKIMMYVEKGGKKTSEEFDFDKLPEDFYTYAYIPICEKITGKETGLEEKFGGSFPFLTKENKMPEDFIFLCQFKDPREENSNIMYQVFVDEELNIDNDYYEVRKIKLDKELIKKQFKYDVKSKLKPYNITGWKKKKELISFSNLKEKLNLSGEIEDILFDMYYDEDNNNSLPHFGIKVGGTPFSTQNCDYDELDLIQLASSEFLDFMWGDSGVAHVGKNGDLEWDCC
jgi:hypothetical protein